MKRLTDINALPMSESTRKKNPHLFASGGIVPSGGSTVVPEGPAPFLMPAPKKRLRQSAKPLMNSNELAFQSHLAAALPGAFVRAQSVHLQLANGVRYTPDFMTYEPMNQGRVCFWEVKGQRKIFDGAGEKLKFAATRYREFVFFLVWRDAGVWREQRILP